MGIYRTIAMGISIFSVSTAFAAAGDTNRILSRLEKGETVYAKSGSSFFVQSIVNKEPEKVSEAFSDLKRMPEIFKDVAFARPYVTADGKQFIYLKMRGVGDGVGVLMEVKQAPSDAFVGAKELALSSDSTYLRETASEVDVSKEAGQLELKKQIETANEKGATTRMLGISSGIMLEGPINNVAEMPNVRFTIYLGFSSYLQMAGGFNSFLAMPDSSLTKASAKKVEGIKSAVAAKPGRKTYLVAKVAFGTQVPKESIGDYRGFGERRLSLATQLGVDVMTALKTSLQNF